jgi:hypothetical protein
VDRALTDSSIQDLYVAGDNPGMGKIAAQYLIDNGTYILDSPLVTPDNAAQYYFPDSPF